MSQRPGSIADGRWTAGDGDGPWALVKEHRLYCAAMVAIVFATMFGAHWAATASASVVTQSSPSPATVEITDAGPAAPADPAPNLQPER